ncbi:DnaA regulatory inactivator Hda [Biformimicrobium ophioploci]|nr:DnaA regulatory inactivator Hda [Microbulbifer sp. NKW57]
MRGNQQPQQLPLGVSVRDHADFSNFFLGQSGANRQLLQQLQAFVTSAQEQFLFIWGEPGSGVSHLLQAACNAAEEADQSSLYLPLSELVGADPQELLDGLERMEILCIDDLQLLEHRPDWQEAVFHLYNRIRDAGGRLLIGAHNSPRGLAIELADLRSRLQWGVTYQVESLSDDDKVAALCERARKRGFNLPEDVARYILYRSPRNTAVLFACLEQLDKASLMEKRRLTLPFVKQVLGI